MLKNYNLKIIQVTYFFLITLLIQQCYKIEDLVTDLNEETGYNLPWYSGYLDVSNSQFQMQSHYFFYPSQNNPQNDPLILWLNGGPGCSSLLGASQENGPWKFKIDSTEIELNEFSWNKKANVLYLESPPGVGFSQSTKTIWDDEDTAQTNLDTLIQFFKNFQQFQTQDFYISGESYAGIYIPMLAEKILQHNKQVPIKEKIQLKGFIIGNGCTDPMECSITTTINPFFWKAFADQGFYTPTEEAEYYKYCGQIQNPNTQKLNSIDCNIVAQSQIQNVITNVNVYNLIGICYKQNIQTWGQNTWLYKDFLQNKKSIYENPQKVEYLLKNNINYEKQFYKNMENEELPPCTDGIGPMTFFNQQYVKKALHVDTNIYWTMCSDEISSQYIRTKKGTYHLYKKLIENNLRIWIYSGDTDAAVPTQGTLYWINKLAEQYQYKTTVNWRAWYTDGIQYGYQCNNRQNAGQFWQNEALTVVTFKGCGHMVPIDNSVGSYDMIQAFLENKQLPAY